jgi:HK97 gp10 family phage protein
MGIKGADRHLRRLKAMRGRAIKEASKLVEVLADMHLAEASSLITTGAVSGKNHVPSKPGEPPNEDLGGLRNSGHRERVGPLKVNSVFDAPYAAALEFGTSKMEERPFARPAAKKVRKAAGRLAKAAAKRISAGGTL